MASEAESTAMPSSVEGLPSPTKKVGNDEEPLLVVEVLWPSILPAALASKQQMGVSCMSFSAARPWMSG